ncbi:ubiquinone biosynthesis monooxygenase Coq7 [Methylohalomonas lacus]|uniref:3-demethoxyubiquinol 3-hydroxylase n=1 Tax=Methylohalomonas lacus TaxID=398773 RepID=A0AAE3L177_9GAMM|nr:2-polyprenyl-3-methyl-6-methoxy-1,4-benzoquinone monooxygenase [Methylohalomonas lacus]MCS3903594.1 ubiquinone biosynthesis monooxygenase Coq7 [Methylohalomonas lacus]
MTQLRRQFSPTDNLIRRFDGWLRRLQPAAAVTRPNPAADTVDSALAPAERRHSAALMRVNHSGEVCAQALYCGQALTARQVPLRRHLLAAAAEEADHLAWCAQRLQELDDRTSYLNPLWYAGSLAIGSLAGLSGDRWSLGFVAETERQVEQHLEGHRQRLPAGDRRSRAIVEQMQADEVRHGRDALNAGGRVLPGPVRLAMRASARVMTTTSYWL